MNEVILEGSPVQTHIPTIRELELSSSETSKLQRIKGSPRIWYVEIKEGGAGIFKPKKYSDVHNERAAYLVSHTVGFDFVPTTILRTLEGEEGSLQDVVRDAKFLYELTEDERLIVNDDLYKLWIFGHVIRNMDRHDENFLLKNGKGISIDHDSSFDGDYKNPDNFDLFRHYYGKQAPPSLITMFKNYSNNQNRQNILKYSLDGIISSKDIEITMKRLDHISSLLVQNGKIDSREELIL